jgi:hypothetical protein
VLGVTDWLSSDTQSSDISTLSSIVSIYKKEIYWGRIAQTSDLSMFSFSYASFLHF